MPNYRHIEMFAIKNSKFPDQDNEAEYVIITIKSM